MDLGLARARVVNLAAEPVVAALRSAPTGAREASLLGKPGPALPVVAGTLRLELGASEIRTVQLRRGTDAAGRLPRCGGAEAESLIGRCSMCATPTQTHGG